MLIECLFSIMLIVWKYEKDSLRHSNIINAIVQNGEIPVFMPIMKDAELDMITDLVNIMKSERLIPQTMDKSLMKYIANFIKSMQSYQVYSDGQKPFLERQMAYCQYAYITFENNCIERAFAKQSAQAIREDFESFKTGFKEYEEIMLKIAEETDKKDYQLIPVYVKEKESIISKYNILSQFISKGIIEKLSIPEKEVISFNR